jgi:hypothetical protein
MANNFPNLLPSLNIDMCNGIYVDPRITFSRAGTRTYYGQEVVKAEENLFLNSVWAGAVSGTPGTPPTSWVFVTSGGTLTVSGASIEFFAAAGQRQSIAQVFNVVTGQEIRVSVDVDSVTGTGTDALVFIETLTTATLSSNVRVLVSDGTGRKTASATVTASGQVRIRIGAAVESIATTDCTVSMKAPQFEIRSAVTAYTATTTQPITRYQRLLKTAAANEWPREFDPVTGECLGRSVWESRTNLLLRSEEFDNASWVKVNTNVIANQIIAPDGTLTADKLVETTANGTHDVYQNFVTSVTTYSNSHILKAGERTKVAFRIGAGVVGRVNLTTGVVEDAIGIGSIVVTSLGNGWFRISNPRTNSDTATRSFGIAILDASNNTSYEGDGYSGIYIWGAQLEAGAFATPYIPTVAAQVTRLADSAVMTGVNFSSWYRQDEGAFFVDSTNSGAFGIPINIHDGTANNQYQVLTGTSGTAFLVNTAGVIQANFGTRANPAKTSVSYKFNDLLASTNGSVPATDTSATLPLVNACIIGSRYDNSNHINGYIKRLTYYPQALTSANLQAITR